MKKGQSQIITTVLIILLVLAAIVIVWQVVQGTIRGGSEEIEETSTCVGTYINVVSAWSTGGEIVLTREPGGASGAVGYKILVNGEQVAVQSTLPANKDTLNQLESVTAQLGPAFNPEDKIQVSAMVGEQACGLSSEFTDIDYCGDGEVNGAEACEDTEPVGTIDLGCDSTYPECTSGCDMCF